MAWIDEQIESARLQCVHAVDFNKTLQRELANVTDAIKSISCQSSCSGQGICVNGNFKILENVYVMWHTKNHTEKFARQLSVH